MKYLEYKALSQSEWATAKSMWIMGRDTDQIAKFLHVPEHIIYNGLTRLKIREAA